MSGPNMRIGVPALGTVPLGAPIKTGGTDPGPIAPGNDKGGHGGHTYPTVKPATPQQPTGPRETPVGDAWCTQLEPRGVLHKGMCLVPKTGKTCPNGTTLSGDRCIKPQVVMLPPTQQPTLPDAPQQPTTPYDQAPVPYPVITPEQYPMVPQLSFWQRYKKHILIGGGALGGLGLITLIAVAGRRRSSVPTSY